MAILIQPAAEIYIESFHRCLDAVARERRYLGATSAPSIEATYSFVKTIIDQEWAQYYALNDEGDVVGWCDILPNPRELFAHVGALGMGVHADYRGQGIGRRLMETCLAHVKAEGIERIELEVYADNATAIALYRKLGFQHEGVKVRGAKIDGRYLDVVMMALFV